MEIKNILAERIADLTYDLFENCQQKIGKIAISMNLTVAEFKTLRLLKKEQFQSVGEIAKRMGLSNGRLTRITDGLVLKGIIKRIIDPKDRRVVDIILTQEGIKITNLVKGRYFQSQIDITESIPEEKINQLISSLEIMNTSLTDWMNK